MWLWLSAPSALLFSRMSALSPAAVLGVTCSLGSGLLQAPGWVCSTGSFSPSAPGLRAGSGPGQKGKRGSSSWWKRWLAAYGYVEEGSGRRFDGVRGSAYAAALRNDYGVYAGAFGGTGYGSEIAGVRQTVENEDERSLAALVDFGYDVGDVLICDRCDRRYHALVIAARDAVEPFYRHVLHRNATLPQLLAEGMCRGTVKVFLDEHFVNLNVSLEGFEQSVNSEYVVRFLHCRLRLYFMWKGISVGAQQFGGVVK